MTTIASSFNDINADMKVNIRCAILDIMKSNYDKGERTKFIAKDEHGNKIDPKP